MIKLYDLHVALRLYYSNIMMLHWNSIGEDFNDSHKSITSEYYDLCYKYIDETAEMLARLNINVPNYVELTKYIEESPIEFFVVDSGKMYSRKDSIELVDKMFTLICKLIEDSLSEPVIQDDMANVGIKSDLEAMHSEFDLQLRYINKRRLGYAEQNNI